MTGPYTIAGRISASLHTERIGKWCVVDGNGRAVAYFHLWKAAARHRDRLNQQERRQVA